MECNSLKLLYFFKKLFSLFLSFFNIFYSFFSYLLFQVPVTISFVLIIEHTFLVWLHLTITVVLSLAFEIIFIDIKFRNLLRQIIKFQIMGGKNSKIQNLKFKKADWTKIDTHQYYDVVKNKNGEEAQLYHLACNETIDVDKQIDIYQYRSNSMGRHVRVIGLQSAKERTGLCGTQQMFNVLTERIPLLLSQCRNLNQTEAIIVLYNAIKGYNQLSHRFGYYAVNGQKIGFNEQGQTKVWINENFGSNHKPIQAMDFRQMVNEQIMLHQICNAVEKRTAQGLFFQPFRTQLYSTKEFQQCLNFIVNSRLINIQILESNIVKIYEPCHNQEHVTSSPIYYQTHNVVSPRGTRVSFNYISPVH